VVVEVAGVVVLVPETAPITGLIESEVAPVAVQLRVVVPFGAMGFGDALKAVTEGGDPLFTVTVTDAVEVLFDVSVEIAQRVVEPFVTEVVSHGIE
jgi:hypothetical protein